MTTCPICGKPMADGASMCADCRGNLAQVAHEGAPASVPAVPGGVGGAAAPRGRKSQVGLGIAVGAGICAACVVVALLVMRPWAAGASGGTAAPTASATAGSGTVQEDGLPAGAAQPEADAELARQKAARHEELRAQALLRLRESMTAYGEQAYEGTIHVIGGEEMCERSGVPIDCNGPDAAARYRAGHYVVLDFDEPTLVRGIMLADEKFDEDFPFVCLADDVYADLRDDYYDEVASWQAFEGMRVCVCSSECSISSGVDIVGAPTLYYPMLCYAIYDGVRDGSVDTSGLTTPSFSVRVPQSWGAADWQATQVTPDRWLVTQTAQGEGSVLFSLGNGLLNGFEIVDSVNNEFGVSMMQLGDGVVGEGMATVEVVGQ